MNKFKQFAAEERGNLVTLAAMSALFTLLLFTGDCISQHAMTSVLGIIFAATIITLNLSLFADEEKDQDKK